MAHSTDLEDTRSAKMGGVLPDLFDGTVYFWIALWLGLTALALTIDQPIYDFVRHRQHRAFMYVCDFMECMGGYSVHLLVLLIVAACRNWKRILVGYLTPMVGLAVFSTLVKYAVGRARPFSHLGAFHFEPLRHAGAHMNSFPSGDAVSAMALATLLGIYFPRCRWLFLVVGLWASLARVATGHHYLSDVVFGAGLAIAGVALSVRLLGPLFYARSRG